jgi:hypothetical protein
MNLVDELRKRHSKTIKDRIVRYIGSDAKRFNELVKIFVGNDDLLTRWAGWPLSDVVRKHPAMIAPHLKQVLKLVDRPKAHEAVKRDVMRLLQFIDIPGKLAGLAFDKAFTLFSDSGEAIAVRVFAMQVMADVAMKEPGLKNEVILAIEADLPYGSPAYRSRARRLLKTLKS